MAKGKRIRAKKRKPSLSRRVAKWIGISLAALWMVTLLQVLLVRFINPPFTTMMAWNWIWNIDNARSDPPHYLWIPLNEISPHLRQAVLAGEDQRFLLHHGFDFIEMNKALKDMAVKRRFRGASTITMQVARSVFLWPGRNLVRKIIEAYYTMLIEFLWDKKRILEIYLNTVDWGKQMVGAEAASRRYFHRSASFLSPSQAALLAAVLPNPHRWSPVKPNARVLRRKERILEEMDSMPLL
jgi:monofunctional biosynthetic peptidoglycan transglycosylase